METQISDHDKAMLERTCIYMADRFEWKYAPEEFWGAAYIGMAGGITNGESGRYRDKRLRQRMRKAIVDSMKRGPQEYDDFEPRPPRERFNISSLELREEMLLTLSRKERIILRLYHYRRGYSMRELGRIFGCTESNISRIRTKAVSKMADRMEKVG